MRFSYRMNQGGGRQADVKMLQDYLMRMYVHSTPPHTDTTLHYTTLHYTTLHCTTPHRVTNSLSSIDLVGCL
eukprot:COSAG06_NODE_8453_length_2170_cov_2.412844_3_plen_72_part_00